MRRAATSVAIKHKLVGEAMQMNGQVILQSLTHDGMASALARREGHDDRTGITGGPI